MKKSQFPLFWCWRGIASNYKHNGFGFDFHSSKWIIFIYSLWWQGKAQCWVQPLSTQYLECVRKVENVVLKHYYRDTIRIFFTIKYLNVLYLFLNYMNQWGFKAIDLWEVKSADKKRMMSTATVYIRR